MSHDALLRPEQVFNPSSFPRWTYVSGGDKTLGSRVEYGLDQRLLVCVIGPTKTGKTVLVHRVLRPRRFIAISGSELSEEVSFWDVVLTALEEPASRSVSTSEERGTQWEVGGQADGAAAPFTKLGVSAKYGRTSKAASTKTNTYGRNGFRQAVDRLSGTTLVILLDDFHYAPEPAAQQTAHALKSALQHRLRVVLIASDAMAHSVVEWNNELQGRTLQVRLGPWPIDHLTEIAVRGFRHLGYALSDEQRARIAREARGSPHLAQLICWHVCDVLFPSELELRTRQNAPWGALDRTLRLSEPQMEAALRACTSVMDYSHVLATCARGTEDWRRYRDAADHDRLRTAVDLTLKAIAADATLTVVRPTDLLRRVHPLCRDSVPSEEDLGRALRHLGGCLQGTIARQSDDGAQLSFTDPHFRFFLSWGDWEGSRSPSP